MKKAPWLSWINHRCCKTLRSCLFLTFPATSLEIASLVVNFSPKWPTLVYISVPFATKITVTVTKLP